MITILEVDIGGARYGVRLERVLEVAARVWLTPLPDAPPHVVGVFSYRGDLAVALDLRARLGQPPSPPRTTDHFVVVGGHGRAIALVVDRAIGARAIDPAALRASPVSGTSLVRTIAVTEEGLVLLEDPDALVSAEDLSVLDAAIARHAPAVELR